MLTLCIIMSNFSVFTQIIMEHEYVSGAVNKNNLNRIELYLSGSKYQMIDVTNYIIYLYNLDHTIFKTLSVPTQEPGQIWDIYYVSEKLFDTDSSDIEYLLSIKAPEHCIKIYDEYGSLLLKVDSASLGGYDFYVGYNPIFNTASGPKMILSSNLNGWGRVYSLPGTLEGELVSIEELNSVNEFRLSDPYPNPAIEYTRIDYKLPPEVIEGEIVFYNTQGQEINRFKVNGTSDHIKISTIDIPAGIYFYTLQTNIGRPTGSKLIKIK